MCFLIDWISQSAMALYIYRVGGFVPQEILLQDLNLRKSLVVLGLCLDWSDLPVRPVGLLPGRLQRPTGQTARTDRSDRSMPILVVNSHIKPQQNCKSSILAILAWEWQ